LKTGTADFKELSYSPRDVINASMLNNFHWFIEGGPGIRFSFVNRPLYGVGIGAQALISDPPYFVFTPIKAELLFTFVY